MDLNTLYEIKSNHRIELEQWKSNMTLIIGAVCPKEGVLLIGDRRKTTKKYIKSEKAFEDSGYENKIFEIPIGEFNLIIGYSGNVENFKTYLDEIRKINANTEENLIIELGKIKHNLNLYIKYKNEKYDILFTLINSNPKLYYLEEDGKIEEKQYYAIGTGEQFADYFFKLAWNENKNMGDTIKLAFFSIIFLHETGFIWGTVGYEKEEIGDTLINRIDQKIINKGKLEERDKPDILEHSKKIINEIGNFIKYRLDSL